MAVKAIGEYSFPAMDSVDKYGGNQLIYIGWDQHTMINSPMAFPVSPDMLFADIIENLMPPAFSQHPDFEHIKWGEVQWLRDNKPFEPNMENSIKENGIVHKGSIRFKTPSLNGIEGTGS